MRWAAAGLCVMAAACALGSGAGRGAEPRQGDEVTGTLVSVSAQAGLRVDAAGKTTPVYTLRAQVTVTGAEGRCVITGGEFTHALDEEGENLVVAPKRRAEERSRAEFLFRSMGRGGRGFAQPSATLSRLPRRFVEVRGEATGYVAERIVLEEVPLSGLGEVIEVVPGLTFEWTSVKVGSRTATLAYEVRVKREKGERAGLEPVFGGLDIRTPDNKPVSVTTPDRGRGGEDEVVITAKDFQVPLLGEKEPRIAVRVYDGLKPVRVEFKVGPVAVSD